MTRLVAVCSSLVLVGLAGVVPAQAQSSVTFKQGQSVIRGTLESQKHADFAVALGAGQTLSVEASSSTPGVQFTVLSPGRLESLYASIFSGPAMKPRRVPIKGSYVIRVYRSASKSGGTGAVPFSVRVAMGGSALAPSPRPLINSWHRTGQALARVPLLTGVQRASVGVLWYRGGEATVQIETSMSMRRVLVEKGMVVAHDSREAVRLVKRGLDYVFSFGRGPVEEYTLPASLLKKP